MRVRVNSNPTDNRTGELHRGITGHSLRLGGAVDRGLGHARLWSGSCLGNRVGKTIQDKK